MDINNSVNTPAENPVLRELFDRSRSDLISQDERKKVMNDIAEEIVMHARLLSVVRLSKPPVEKDGGAVLQEGTKIMFAMLNSNDGKRFYPAFTDNAELDKWESMKSEEFNTVLLGFDDYASMVIKSGGADGVVINPFGDNLMLDKLLMEHWNEKKQLRQNGHSEHIVNPNADIKLGVPDPFNMELSVALTTAAKKNASVKSLWLRGIVMEGQKGYLAVVDFKGSRTDVFNSLGEAAKPFIGGYPLHIVAHDEGLGKAATKDVMPIYKA